MRCILSLITLGALVLLGDQSWARRDALTAEQKSQLERIDRVLVDVIVLSDKGSLDAKPPGRRGRHPHERIRLHDRDRSDPTARCGTEDQMRAAKDLGGHHHDGERCRPSRCAVTNLERTGLSARLSPQREKNGHGAKRSGQISTTPKPRPRSRKPAIPRPTRCAKLQARLEEYDFPALITAEWGQEARLFRLYDDPKDSGPRAKVKHGGPCSATCSP
jgi:hypothetical protein